MEVEHEEMKMQQIQAQSHQNHAAGVPTKHQANDDTYLQEISKHPELVTIIHSSKHIYSTSLIPLNDQSAEYVV